MHHSTFTWHRSWTPTRYPIHHHPDLYTLSIYSQHKRDDHKTSKELNSWQFIQRSICSPSTVIPRHLSNDAVSTNTEDINISNHFDQRIRNGFIRYLEHSKVPEISSTFSQKMQYQSLKHSRSCRPMLPEQPPPGAAHGAARRKRLKKHHSVPLIRNIFDVKGGALISTQPAATETASTTTTREIRQSVRRNKAMNPRRAERAYHFLKFHLDQPYPSHHHLLKRKMSVRLDKTFQKRANMRMQRSFPRDYIIGNCHRARMRNRA